MQLTRAEAGGAVEAADRQRVNSGKSHVVGSLMSVRTGFSGGVAGTAQRFRRTISRGCAHDDVDGCGQVDLPAGVHDQRADPRLSTQPACDDVVSHPEQTRGTSTIRWPIAYSEEWTVRESDRGHRELRAQMHSQSSPARMVTARAVDEQHVRTTCQSPRRLLHHSTYPEGQESWDVGRSSNTRSDELVDDFVPSHHRDGSPRRVSGAAATGQATGEAHPAPADADPTVLWRPWLGSGVRQLSLTRDQGLDVGRPHASRVPRNGRSPRHPDATSCDDGRARRAIARRQKSAREDKLRISLPPRPLVMVSRMKTLHTAYRVTDLAASLVFYSALGYQEVGRIDIGRGASLTVLKFTGEDVGTLELVHRPADGSVDIGTGFSHLVVQIDNLASSIEALSQSGLKPDPPQRPGGPNGPRTSWLTDPDGYRIELVEWPSGHPDGITAEDFA
jgi:lactoylglutathione lyase